MNAKTEDGLVASPPPSTRCNARFAAAHGKAVTVESIVSEGSPTLAAPLDGAFYRVRAKAATDPSVTARFLQCFARSSLIPHLFLAMFNNDGELSIEAWLRQREIDPHALNRIVGNIGAVVGVVSTELTCEPRQSAEICQPQ